MELLLWRHAEAEDGFPDAARRLSPHGEAQAQRMAAWILAHAPKNLRIVASPATRCQQTAAALGLPFETDQRLSTKGNVADLLAVAGWPCAETPDTDSSVAILIIGHQPTLGRTASLLLFGQETEWGIKKGAVTWLSRLNNAQSRVLLQASLTPRLVDGHKKAPEAIRGF